MEEQQHHVPKTQGPEQLENLPERKRRRQDPVGDTTELENDRLNQIVERGFQIAEQRLFTERRLDQIIEQRWKNFEERIERISVQMIEQRLQKKFEEKAIIVEKMLLAPDIEPKTNVSEDIPLEGTSLELRNVSTIPSNRKVPDIIYHSGPRLPSGDMLDHVDDKRPDNDIYVNTSTSDFRREQVASLHFNRKPLVQTNHGSGAHTVERSHLMTLKLSSESSTRNDSMRKQWLSNRQDIIADEHRFKPYSPGTKPLNFSPSVGSLFHSESTKSLQDVDSAKDFFDDLRSFSNTLFEDPEYMKVKPETRVRIAILDTGIDESHPEVQGMIANGRLAACQSWIGIGEDWMDDDPERHGTHCAFLLHEVAPEADIYVAKVFTENKLRLCEAQHIAAAIRHAVEHWHVDIVTMSFGLERPPSEENMTEYRGIIRDIEDAIQEAAPLLMFAAASNGGKGYPRTFPATDDNVICIHASNGKGKDADINPKGRPGDGFMTLGVAVQFLHGGDHIQMTGTSFATPIAAGMAANILYFACGCGERLDDAVKRRLRKKQGMRQMFQLMSKDIPGYYRFVAPWNLWGKNWKSDKHVDDHIWSTINATLGR